MSKRLSWIVCFFCANESKRPRRVTDMGIDARACEIFTLAEESICGILIARKEFKLKRLFSSETPFGSLSGDVDPQVYQQIDHDFFADAAIMRGGLESISHYHLISHKRGYQDGITPFAVKVQEWLRPVEEATGGQSEV